MTMKVLAAIGDPEGTRTMTSIVALLAMLGLALVMLAVWLFKTTRPDPSLLAPLEAMSERKWRRADPVWQRRRLDHLRPEGAQPLAPSVAPPDIDEAFDLGPAGTGFDDLHEDHHGPSEQVVMATEEGLAPTPAGLARPRLDDLPEREMDPVLVAAAMAELEAELGQPPLPGLKPTDDPTDDPTGVTEGE